MNLPAPSSFVFLSFGNTRMTRSIIPSAELDVLKAESFIARSQRYCLVPEGKGDPKLQDTGSINAGSSSAHFQSSQNRTCETVDAIVISADGRDGESSSKNRFSHAFRHQVDWKYRNLGALYGIYAVLEHLGFAFLHFQGLCA